MKKILLINFILIQTLIFSQESLSGEYCYAFDDVYTCMIFLENQRFEFRAGDDLGESSIGFGNYELVENNKLILIFDKTEKVYHSIVETKNIRTNSKDSIRLNFHFFDSYKRELPFVNLEKDSITNFSADKFGNLEIIESKNSSESTYKISWIGYEVLPINLKMDADKEIIIYLSQWKPKVISGKTFEYELIEIQDGYFKTSQSSPYEKDGVIYKKIK